MIKRYYIWEELSSMSWLLIRGKMLHCEECGAQQAIEYEEGPLLTQIGDLNVLKQMELNEQCMPEKYNCQTEGYYFHIDGFYCEKCINDKTQRPEGIFVVTQNKDVLSNMNQIIEDYKGKAEAMQTKCVGEILLSISLEDIIAIAPRQLPRIIILAKGMNEENKKEELSRFIRKHVNPINKMIMGKVYMHPAVKRLDEEYQKALEKEEKNILAEVEGKAGIHYYHKIDLLEIDCLNPYICYEGSMRQPIAENRFLNFYGEGGYDIDPDRLHYLIGDEYISRFLDDEKAKQQWAKPIMEKLMRETTVDANKAKQYN